MQVNDTARLDLIAQIEAGNITLSFSGIKEFSKSPSHFIAYKLGEKKQTAAMKKGSFIHCAILEPDEIEKRYSILRKEDLPNPDSDFRNSANKEFKISFEQKAESENKEIITPEEYIIMLDHKDLAYNNEVIAPFLNRLTKRESYAEWEFCGYKWRGVRDGVSNNFILDLKTVADASPDRIKWVCESEKYHWQQYLYLQSPDIAEYYTAYNLLVDGNMGIALFEVSWNRLQKAKAELESLLEKFKMCTENNLWHQNYEFWANNQKGIYIIE